MYRVQDKYDIIQIETSTKMYTPFLNRLHIKYHNIKRDSLNKLLS